MDNLFNHQWNDFISIHLSLITTIIYFMKYFLWAYLAMFTFDDIIDETLSYMDFIDDI